MADVWVKTGSFVTPASGSTVISTTSKGTNPKGIWLYWSRLTADDTVQADQFAGHGFSDGTTHRAFFTNAQDGAENNRRENLNTGALLIANLTDTREVVGGAVTMNVNDVTLAYATFTSGFTVQYVIFGGTDCGAEVDEMAASASPFTGLANGKPDLVLFCCTGNAITNLSQHAFMSFGAAHDNGASIEQWCMHTYMGDNASATIGGALVSGNNAGQYNLDYTAWQTAITVIGATGFTWTGTNADEWAALSLTFDDGAGGSLDVQVGTFTKATGAAPVTQALPALGFTPQYYSLATQDITVETINVDRTVHVAHGNYDGVDANCILAVGTQGGNTDRASKNHLSEVLQTSSALQATGVVASATPQAITDATPDIEWNPNNAVAVIIGYFAVEEGGDVIYDQDGFQFINDDGSESAATDLAAEDTNATQGRGVNTRLRIQTDTTVADSPTITRTIRYKETADADGEYRDVPVA